MINNLPEGYVKHEANNYNYVFNYTDHLGNIRLSYSTDPSTKALEILEENNYYPFGLKHANYNMSRKAYYKSGGDLVLEEPCPSCPIDFKYNYKYNGKEYQDELGLNLYDYGARNYDAALGRWMNVDNKAEKYFNISPYVYVANMPTIAIDLDGNDIFIPLKGDANSSANRKQIHQIKTNLQKLTNSKLRLVETKGGYLVKEVSGGKANSDKELTNGTSLISGLISSESLVTIKTGNENISLKSDNGNTSITFNPDDKGERIANEDGTTGRPSEIGLAHELLHADENTDGKTDNTEVSILNPDGDSLGSTVKADKDELTVRERENKIRKEQGVTPRATPMFSPKKE
ncbi:hypothetical protein SY27_04945 [Flavobacterium sp. 316]|uniref:RHS repeat-associated core domain-containing protein n=1 Tax=Flavobacterium sp. 316 TaxID=1603293 RepID=UPI0005E63103|nr:RHS repeat-associated core domain-containing protein [Flavobacterium sp. 316]KIX22024.1 hypothetical protein SY27_04945 [Flavobacterium sp. 316]